jgi:hypothetical protein
MAAAAEAAATAQREAVAAQGQSAANTFAGVKPQNIRQDDADYAARASDIEAYFAALDEMRARLVPLAAASQEYTRRTEARLRPAPLGDLSQDDPNYQRRAADIAAWGAAMDAARAKIDPLFRASKQYEAELDLIDLREKQLVLTETQATSARQQATTAFASASAPLKASNADMGALATSGRANTRWCFATSRCSRKTCSPACDRQTRVRGANPAGLSGQRADDGHWARLLALKSAAVAAWRHHEPDRAVRNRRWWCRCRAHGIRRHG